MRTRSTVVDPLIVPDRTILPSAVVHVTSPLIAVGVPNVHSITLIVAVIALLLIVSGRDVAVACR
jgi:hypothetical protein